jgi:hypothetical protein
LKALVRVLVPALVRALVPEPVRVRAQEPARVLAKAKPLVTGRSGRVRHCHNLPPPGHRRREIPLKRKSVERWFV